MQHRRERRLSTFLRQGRPADVTRAAQRIRNIALTSTKIVGTGMATTAAVTAWATGPGAETLAMLAGTVGTAGVGTALVAATSVSSVVAVAAAGYPEELLAAISGEPQVRVPSPQRSTPDQHSKPGRTVHRGQL